ncbi:MULTISPECIES: DUF262 domain-containing protein [unclassified Mesorhizobium]|uniref:DUF262 domain-containing protein n=1 Tax=unclassified Mesorhizobium TaxID=325217 RepID=UPI00333D270F
MDMLPKRRALDKIYKRRDRYEIPDWQRSKVWSADQKRKLIDTILRGWKLPKFYFLKTDAPDEFEVVDGQQRLSAIWEFFDGELTLSPAQSKFFGGQDYKNLPSALSDAFDDYEIEYDEITDATDEDIKDFFQRLQEGLPLTTSEKLNSIHSKLRDFCAETAEHPFFVETVKISDKRHAHFDIAAKVVTIEVNGLNTGLRFEDVKKVFEANSNFSPKSAAAERVTEALKFFHESFPAAYGFFRNRTIVQAALTLVCHLQNSGLAAEQKPALKAFIEWFLAELSKQVELGQKATDPSFLAFQRTVNANVKSGAKTRQEILLRHLFRHQPQFYSGLSLSAGMVEGLAKDRGALSKSVRDLISSINEKYAAKHGHDLFKPTNKTATALSALGSTTDSLEDYKKFVEHLYFLFRESIGQRLENNLPESFKHVNSLRTQLAHDVDHGKAGQIAKKKKDLGAVFKIYSGATTPESIDPAQFALVQVNLLAALESDLVALSKSQF